MEAKSDAPTPENPADADPDCSPAGILSARRPDGRGGGQPRSIGLDPDGGYTGDYVVIINGNLGGKGYLSTGMIGDQIDKDIRPLKLPHPNFKDLSVYDAPQKGSPDPFLPEDDSLKQEDMAALQAGHLKVFRMDDEWSPGGSKILFKLLHVGTHCRVWTPVNPDYYPLDSLDPGYAGDIAREFDAKYPLMTQMFGAPSRLPGDGKIELLFYDIAGQVIGFFWPVDVFVSYREGGQVRESNHLPMLHMDTFGVSSILQVDDQGKAHHQVDRIYPTITHELQHLLFMERNFSEYPYDETIDLDADRAYWDKHKELEQHINWLEELLSAAATILPYPWHTMQKNLPAWYQSLESFEAVAEALVGRREAYSRNRLYNGESIFDFGEHIHYPLMNMLALFARHRGGDGIFLETSDLCFQRWNEEEALDKPVQMLAEALGYIDFADFFQDFVLSLLLHDPDLEGGRFSLFPLNYSEEMDRTAALIRPLMLPQVSTSDIKFVFGTSFLVFKTKSGVFVPPTGSGAGLRYAGFSLKAPEE